MEWENDTKRHPALRILQISLDRPLRDTCVELMCHMLRQLNVHFIPVNIGFVTHVELVELVLGGGVCLPLQPIAGRPPDQTPHAREPCSIENSEEPYGRLRKA